MRTERIPVSFVRAHTLAPVIEEAFERIKAKAFRYFEERGAIDGYALDDWLRAEGELIRKPEIHVKVFNEDIVFEVQTPGIDAGDLDLTVTPSEMVVASRSVSGAPQLFRMVRFPEPIDLDSVDAEYANDTLRITATVAGAREQHHHIRINVA